MIITNWTRFIITFTIIIYALYFGYNYINHENNNTKIDTNIPNIDTHKQNINITEKIILSRKVRENMKENFGKIDNNFSNRAIHTKEGLTIERIR